MAGGGAVHQRLQHGLPDQLRGGDEDDARPGHGGRGGVGEGLGLEAALHSGGHGDPVPVGEG